MNPATLALALRLKAAFLAPRTVQEQREDAIIVQSSPYLPPGIARRLLYGICKNDVV